MTGFLRAVVADALNPMLRLLSDTLLSTPNPSQLPRLVELWTGSWEIVLAGYALLVAGAGILLMSYHTVQSAYTLRELGPRIVLGFCTGALSLTGASAAIEATNTITAAVLAGGVDEAAGADALAQLITSAVATGGTDQTSDGLFLVVLGLVVAAVLLALLLSFIVRVALTIVLIAGAPIALMFHALPHTDGIARWWWRTFAALLAIQLVQSLTLVVGLRVLLTPGGLGLFGLPTDTGFITLLVVLALLYILFKIPFWLLAAARIGHGRYAARARWCAGSWPTRPSGWSPAAATATAAARMTTGMAAAAAAVAAAVGAGVGPGRDRHPDRTTPTPEHGRAPAGS